MIGQSCFPVLSNSPISLCKGNSAQFLSRFLIDEWQALPFPKGKSQGMSLLYRKRPNSISDPGFLCRVVCCIQTLYFGSNVTCCFRKTEIPFTAFNSFLFILVTGQEEAFNTRLGIQQVEKYSANFFIIKDIVLVLVNEIKFPLETKGKDCLRQRAGRKISIYYYLF